MAENDAVPCYYEWLARNVLKTSLKYGHMLYNVTDELWSGLEWKGRLGDVVREVAAANKSRPTSQT